MTYRNLIDQSSVTEISSWAEKQGWRIVKVYKVKSMRTRQTEVRFLVGTDYLDKLKARFDELKTTDVMRAALALLDWASEEVAQGRVILSTNEQGENIHRLVMPELNQVKSKSLVTTRD